ncbi:MAG: hypothetical protein CL910_11180 [Deltaproteobacteria bacterium]|nr:hypothetical protein [Deltaproteobacteria bacterium]
MNAADALFARLRDPTTQQRLEVAALVVALALSLVVAALGTSLDVWRHDSLYYHPFGAKAWISGRWLTYLLSFPLLFLPGGPLWLAGFLLFGGFAFLVARGFGQDSRGSLLFALLAAQIPCLYGLSLWPVGNLPMPLLLFAAGLAARRLSMWPFYLLFGVLFLGVTQQYYFLLPALHLPEVLASRRGPLRATVRLLAAWVTGFLVGYLVVLVYVYLASGHVGMQVPTWRDPHYVTDLASLLANIATSGSWLLQHLGAAGQLTLGGLTLLAMVVTGAWGTRRSDIAVRVVVFGAMGLALYAVMVPIGVTIHFRSATPVFFALLCFAFLGWSGGRHRGLYPIGVLLVLVPFGFTNLENLLWYRTVTGEYQSRLREVMPKPPEAYEGVVLLQGNARALQARIERESGRRARFIVSELSDDRGIEKRWKPSGLAMGFQRVRYCLNEHCRSIPRTCLAGNADYCVHGETPDRYLLISFVMPSRRDRPRDPNDIVDPP